MLFCAAGDIHGAIEKMYDDVLAFETHRWGHGWTSEAVGLDELVRRLRP